MDMKYLLHLREDSIIHHMNKNNSQHFLGHRKRLKEKFLKNPDSIPDYELVELVLFLSVPRRDVKIIAKNLISKFGNLQNILYAEKQKLMDIDGVTESFYNNFVLMRHFLSRSLKENVMKQNFMGSWSALIEYLRFSMGSIGIEEFRVLFVNKKNNLIADEIMGSGTIDRTPVYPREVIKRALYHGASAIVLVHNHPSSDPNPSKADIKLTSAIQECCNAIGITLHDHVIVTQHKYYSFKSNFLL